MFYTQIFDQNGDALTMRYGPSVGNTWELTMNYAHFIRVQHGIKVYVKTFKENEPVADCIKAIR